MRLHSFAQISALFIIAMGAFYMFLMTAKRHLQFFNEESEFSSTYDANDFCDGENMVYNVSFYGNSSMPSYFKKGKKFNCAFLGHLLHFNITDKFHRIHGPIGKISDPRESNRTPFVLASDFAFYDALRAIIAGIKTQFGKDKHIIVYDLGGLSTQKDPEMFSKFDSFIYCDTSIHFLTNNYGPFFDGINNGILSDFQFPMGTHHGLKFATHPDMFSYFPLDPSLTTNSADDDVEMMEANMLILRRSEFSRQLLKW